MRPGASSLLLLFAACTTGPTGETGARTSALAGRLPASERERIAESSVPVLLPSALPLERARLMPQPVFTALHVPGDGITVSLQASRKAFRYDGVAPAPGSRRVRGGPGHVTRNEGIWTASWIEHGVAYALDLECARAGDARCADDGYLLALVEGLEEVGP